MSDVKTFTIPATGGDITLETGRLAKRAAAAVLVRQGGTVILATVSIDTKETKLDYFPLSVEYIEKLYAGGTISGSRFIKREGFPSEEAIITARQVDHTVRPLFPKGFKKATSVVLTVLAYDGKINPETLTVLGASSALLLSGVPFFGPVSNVVVGVKADGSLLLNPEMGTQEELLGEFVVAGGKDGILSIEGWGKEVKEDKMKELLDFAAGRIDELNAAQTEFAKEIAKPMMEFNELPVSEELISKVVAAAQAQIDSALFQAESENREAALGVIKKELETKLEAAEGAEITAFDIDLAVEYVARKATRQAIMDQGKRLSGRGLEEIRPLSAEVDILPTVHGSALFNRGLTQSLSVVTLGSTRMNQLVDGMEGEAAKGFMHHYNMAGFATGEASKYSYKPGRREIGHGAIGENALKHIVANQDEFPYTIRVVSEVMSGNGSTSMAATCAASLALMAAGVPMKGPVGGIGVGLITNDAGDYKLLLDIEGIEDFYGDMDFKTTGTDQGVTAIQFETKLRGVKVEIMKQAFDLAHKGRLQVLEAMAKAIAKTRDQLAPSAPRVTVIQVMQDQIGELIGPGGRVIKGLVEETEALGDGKVDINIDDSGKVTITTASEKQKQFVLGQISNITAVPEIGMVYDGVIDKVMPYGAFVDVSPGISGLIHVSEMAEGFVKDPAEVVKEGQQVRVKLTKIENGKQSFSMKGVNTKNDSQQLSNQEQDDNQF